MTNLGLQIVILDGGFVYVGNCVINEGFLLIDNARNLRLWGTKKGLGELRTGPTANTVVDDTGEILVPISRVIHFIKIERGWT